MVCVRKRLEDEEMGMRRGPCWGEGQITGFAESDSERGAAPGVTNALAQPGKWLGTIQAFTCAGAPQLTLVAGSRDKFFSCLVNGFSCVVTTATGSCLHPVGDQKGKDVPLHRY